MGLIRALVASASSTLGDQFKEYVTCPETPQGFLVQRGEVHHGKGNKGASEGVISNGSRIVVPEGMAMMIVDNGAIKEFTAEAGEYTYDTSSEPSIFVGGLGEGIKNTINKIGERFTYGGMPARDQRVYYVNLLNITGNKFGSPQPKKITDDEYGMLEVTFFGEYAFKVVDPTRLVATVIGANAKDTVTYDEVVGSQLKAKFIEKMTGAITVVMRKHKIPFGDIGMYGSDISDEMNTALEDSFKENYGLEITDVALQDINLTDESMNRVSKIDDAKRFSNPGMQSGLIASAAADAMRGAATNENGAMMGFMGMNMAMQNGGAMMGAINQNGAEPVTINQKETPEPGTLFKKEEVTPKNEETPVVSQENVASKEETPKTEGGLPEFCPECGTKVVGKFCTNCGKKLGE